MRRVRCDLLRGMARAALLSAVALWVGCACIADVRLLPAASEPPPAGGARQLSEAPAELHRDAVRCDGFRDRACCETHSGKLRVERLAILACTRRRLVPCASTESCSSAVSSSDHSVGTRWLTE